MTRVLRGLGPLLLLLVGLAGIESCGSKSAVSTSRTSAPEDTTPPVIAVLPSEIPELVASRGGVTLVNAWATWCDPCREEFPALLSVARAHARDVRLVLVSTDFPDQVSAVRKFLTSHGVTDTTYMKTGDDMSFINALSPKWTGALPASFVFDAKGRLVEFWEGRSDSSRFDAAINHALAARTPAKESAP
ncbi:MAG TPA: TlpA disulfide reductase family protein [Candidatus Udaeobacter sp.]|nr:TlpA disulfide reductase family protein [Candidatus Udaeobacter sp.]